MSIIPKVVTKKGPEEELRSLKEFHENLLNAITECIVVIQPYSRQIISANRAFLHDLGYEREEEVIGRTCHEIAHGSAKPCCPPCCPCPLNKTLATGQPSTTEHIHLTRQGEERFIEVSTYPVRDETGATVQIVHLSRDITKRKRAERELKSAIDYQHAVFSSLEEAVLTFDTTGRITSCNLAAENIFGYEAADLIGQDTKILHIDDHNRGRFSRAIGRAMKETQKRGFRIKLLMRGSDGHPFSADCTISPLIHSSNGNIGAVCVVRDVTRLKQLQMDALYLKESIRAMCQGHAIVGTSQGIKQVLEKVKLVAKTNATVLVQGETGTGKEIIVRAIHCASLRSKRPLIIVNCAALSPELIESELFGHEKGAFTGAIKQQIGRFELANRGTIFLDEVADIPLATQVKLLRVIQEREFERVGGTKKIRVDVRIVAATNQNLEEAVSEGRFRQDLFYRLNVFPIKLPSLRERREDIPILAKHFMNKYSLKLGKDILNIDPKTMAKLTAYHWPGNVRELENVIERAVILSSGNVLEVPDIFFQAPRSHSEPDAFTLYQAERKHVLQTLEKTNWTIEGPAGAAQLLDLPPSTLRSKMKKLGIKRAQRR